MSSYRGLGIMGMVVDATEHMHAHTAVDMEASGIVLDDVDMDEPEVVADGITTEDLEKLKTLDLQEILRSIVDEAAPESEQAYKIHHTVLENVKNFPYARTFHQDHPYLETQPSFTSAILAAYKNQDYRAILIWRTSSSPRNDFLPGITQRDANKDAMAKQYAVPYKGQAAEFFAKFVQTLAKQAHHYNKWPLYANVIPIIQSSGTGKSRMLTETGKTLFTLPFCAREEDGVGWPPGDNNILAYLLKSPDNQFEIKTHIIFIAFLAAIFAEMKNVLEGFGTSNINTLRQMWHTYMEPAGESTIPTRNGFYANVLKGTKDMESEMKTWNSKLCDVDHSKGLSPEFFNLLVTRVNELSRNFLKAKVDALLNVIQKKVLLVYMDEVHTFGDRYWALQRVLSTLREHRNIWFSFMGTNISLSEFVPAASGLKSGRLAEELMVLLPPYTALGFDQNVVDLDQSPHEPVKMGQVYSLGWICTFGRPLWKAMWEASRAVSAGGVGDEARFFRNAEMKLLCSTADFNGKQTEQVFAILAYTVCLDLVLGTRAATDLANDGVANHLRLLIDVNDDRTISFTEASSEPVLALVGAFIASKRDNLRHIINGLTNNLCKKGLVDKGRHGKLLARMILFIARIQSCSLSPPSTPLLFATPVPVVHFFKTLFGDTWNKASGHKVFDEDLKGGYVNFYHFALTLDTMPEKEDPYLEANLWTRGTALQCSFRQVDIDGHIPVYWGPIDEDAVLDPSKFSSLNYQVKLRNVGDTVSADRIQRPASDRGSAKHSSHPFITVFLDMDSEENHKSTKSRLLLETGRETLQRLEKLNMTELSSQRQKAAKKAIKELKLDPNRYCINARGCDEHVFGVLKTMGIAMNWKKLVEITKETPKAEGEIMQTMLPLQRLNLASGHCDWMNDYSASHNQT